VNSVNGGQVLVGESPARAYAADIVLGVVTAVLPEPAPDDDPRHRGVVEDVARRDVRDAHSVLGGDRVRDAKQFLEQRPAPPQVDHVLVLPQGGGAQVAGLRFRLIQVFFRQQTST